MLDKISLWLESIGLSIARWWDALQVSQNLELGLDVLTPLTIAGSIYLFSSQVIKNRKSEQRIEKLTENLKRTKSTALAKLLDIIETCGQGQVSVLSNWGRYNRLMHFYIENLLDPSTNGENFWHLDKSELVRTLDQLLASIDKFTASIKARHYAIFPTLEAIEGIEYAEGLEHDDSESTAKKVILKSINDLEAESYKLRGFALTIEHIGFIRSGVSKVLDQRNIVTPKSLLADREDNKDRRDFFSLSEEEQEEIFNEILNDESIRKHASDLLIDEQIATYVLEISKPLMPSHVSQKIEMVVSQKNHKVLDDAINTILQFELYGYFSFSDIIERFLPIMYPFVVAKAVNASTTLMVNISALISQIMDETRELKFSDIVEKYDQSSELGYNYINKCLAIKFPSYFSHEDGLSGIGVNEVVVR